MNLTVPMDQWTTMMKFTSKYHGKGSGLPSTF